MGDKEDFGDEEYQEENSGDQNYSDILEKQEEQENEDINGDDSSKIRRGFGDKKYSICLNVISELYELQDFSYDKNQYYIEYKRVIQQPSKLIKQTKEEDGRIVRLYANDRKSIIFSNGVVRDLLANNYTIVHFTNQDIKQQLPDNTIIYYFHQAQTTQTTIQQGPNIYWFSNNQLEIHHPDGNKEIKFSDNTEKYIYNNSNGNHKEITFFTDQVIQILENNTKTIIYPNKSKDVIYPDGNKIRFLPDGQKVHINQQGIIKV